MSEIHEHPAVAAARLRRKCERAVERLLEIIDALGGDADNEPSLGFSEPGNAYSLGLDQRHIAEGATDGREDEHDGREPAEDAEDTLGRTENVDQSRREVSRDDLEPSLGSCDAPWPFDQSHWGGVRQRVQDADLEDEHDGREPDVDDEPSLGATEGETGSANWALPYAMILDAEEQCEDEGGACEDEGHDSDTEADHGDMVCKYMPDGQGGGDDHTRIDSGQPGVAVSPLGVR